MKKNKNITLKVSRLSKFYEEIKASDNISFSAQQGEIIALLGPNGAGKSTLMNMIAGYLAPSSGKIEILGKNISQYPLFAKENTGFLPEGSPLYPDVTVKMFLNYMAELRGVSKQRCAEVLDIANIREITNQRIETLSKGYQRRVGFAQSILSNPPLLLLDEPTDGLDPNQKDYICKLITQMAKNKTILISTHLLEEAETICNRIILLDKGKIKADGDLPSILQTTQTDNLAAAFRKLTTHKEN